MTSAEPHSQKPLARVTEALEKGTLGDVSRMLRKMEPAEAAHLLESSPPRSRQVLWQLIDDDLQGEVLNELGYELQLEFLSELEPAQVGHEPCSRERRGAQAPRSSPGTPTGATAVRSTRACR